MAGVAIILAPELISAWKRVGSMPAFTSPNKIQFCGQNDWRIVVLPNFCVTYDKTQQISGQIKLLIALIYHPVDPEEQVLFNLKLSSFYDKMPRNAKIILGQYVNAYVRIRSKLYADVFGSHSKTIGIMEEENY